MQKIIVAQNSDQQKIAFIKGDHIGDTILRDGTYDHRGLIFIKKILAQLSAPIAFDIGANIGNHALVMSKYCKMVYLFEPQPNIIELLNTTKKLNHLTNWHIFAFGLSNKNDKLPLYKNLDGNNGASTFVSELKGQQFLTEHLPVYVGDEIVSQYGINKIDFMKIDVEAFEAKVLAGFEKTINKLKPIIILEWNNKITKQQFVDYKIFQKVFNNYVIKAITHNHHKSCWHKKLFSSIRRFFYRCFNKKKLILSEFYFEYDYQHILFIPKDKIYILEKL